jgi:predicted metal-binding protein
LTSLLADDVAGSDAWQPPGLDELGVADQVPGVRGDPLPHPGREAPVDAARAALEALFAQHGLTDFRWIEPRRIVVAQWVRIKCAFGCGEYGRNAACPPNTPSVAECREFFREYRTASVFHFAHAVETPEQRKPWAREVNAQLLQLQQAVFLAGYPKAFLLFMDSCRVCAECTGVRAQCRVPQSARPSPEGMAVDVFSTVRQVGYPIEVLTDYRQAMNRYALLLVD